MTLTIHSEEDSQRQLKVTVEVPEERVQAQMRRTARALGREVRIPGFRKGKVPYNVLVRRVGEEALRADAVEEMLESVLMEALDELEDTAYGQPSMDSMEMEPLVLQLTIPLEPTIVLGDYRAIRKEVEPVEVTDEALTEAMEQIRARHQELEDVERPAESGDLVTVSGEGKLDEEDGEVFWHEHETDLVLDPDKIFPDLPFVENIVGLWAGEEKSFRFTFLEDYAEEELAGKEVAFEIKVDKVQSRILPELTDELAQGEGDYETVAELEGAMREQLYTHAEQQAKSDLVDEVVDEMLEDAEIAYPPTLVEVELDSNLENFKEQVTRSGWEWEDYMKLENESEEALRERWRDNAEERVRRGLVVRQFITEEKLTVSQSDIDAALDERLSQFGDNEELREQLRSVFSQGPSLEMMSNEILMAKVSDRMEAIVTGNAPELEALEQESAEISEEEE